MKYVSVAEARELDGLRVALTVQAPGAWATSARLMLKLRNVPFVAVRQDLFAPNKELLDWTGRRNSPVGVYNDEPAIDGWLEFANLAERLGSGPSLFPDNYIDRALAVGLSAEICGNRGFGWARRTAMSGPMPADAEGTPMGAILSAYGGKSDRQEWAIQRSIQIMKGLAEQLHRQRGRGSPWLVGDRLSLCDVHWAVFSSLVKILPQEDCWMTEDIRVLFDNVDDEVREAVDPILIEHRDMVWRDHLGLPLDYLPDEEKLAGAAQ